MVTDNWILMVLMIFITLALAILFTFFPEKVVRFFAKDMYNTLHGFGLSDAEIKKMKMDVFNKEDDKFLHAFIERGMNYPKEFSDMINAIKRSGRVAWFVFFCGLVGILLKIFRGL